MILILSYNGVLSNRRAWVYIGSFWSIKMGDFKPRSGGRFAGRGGSRGSSGGFGGGRGRSFGGDRGERGGGRSFGGGFGGRPRLEMHEATCAKCGKECKVPFRPSSGKPVFCSACFEQNNSNNGFGGRRDSPREFQPRSQAPSQGAGASVAGAGMSQEQFKQLNVKLDKILKLLEMV